MMKKQTKILECNLESSKQPHTNIGHIGCMPSLSFSGFQTLINQAKKGEHPSTILGEYRNTVTAFSTFQSNQLGIFTE